MVEPSGRAGKLSLWKTVNLNKGHKLRCSSFRTALLFLREIITIQPSSAKHTGFCEEFLYIQQPGHKAARCPLLQRRAQHTLASSLWPLLGGKGLPPCCQHCAQPAAGWGCSTAAPVTRTACWGAWALSHPWERAAAKHPENQSQCLMPSQRSPGGAWWRGDPCGNVGASWGIPGAWAATPAGTRWGRD